jgi:hypothetical protein
MKKEQNNKVPQAVCNLVAGVVLDRAVRSPVERRPARTSDILPPSINRNLATPKKP